MPASTLPVPWRIPSFPLPLIRPATMSNNCRMYQNKYPAVDDLVMVNVRQIADMGAYVELLEYDNREGMILLSELSRRRIRSVQKLVRVGRREVVVVLRVDQDKGYIDLSKRRVTPEDVVKCEERYNKSKEVHSILRHVAEKLQVNLESLYELIGWPLYTTHGHAYDAFKMAILEPSIITEAFEENFARLSAEQSPHVQGLPEKSVILDELAAIVGRRMTPQPVKLRADLDLTCFGPKGIDAIIEAIKIGERESTQVEGEQVDIKIKLIAAPMYVMTAQSINKNEGIRLMEEAITKMTEAIKAEERGNLVIRMRPRAINVEDERQLAELMLAAEKEQADTDDSSDSD
ncbi:hypothetical protein, variant [Fonticula alba]|uniref:S1 motif domain-containing protein n=1 Tax=Fonticula alba TaxID=691883 RepID=A0A058ZCC3_FONAL|nr:hypothetical protein, variant [Fonticula alba]KCV72060.1 hypothetical protein, variant [Fonticula alba]|eukprot:XP_009493637.1 hypothetical protein, variant [Fonticula alba]